MKMPLQWCHLPMYLRSIAWQRRARPDASASGTTTQAWGTGDLGSIHYFVRASVMHWVVLFETGGGMPHWSTCSKKRNERLCLSLSLSLFLPPHAPLPASPPPRSKHNAHEMGSRRDVLLNKSFAGGTLLISCSDNLYYSIKHMGQSQWPSPQSLAPENSLVSRLPFSCDRHLSMIDLPSSWPPIPQPLVSFHFGAEQQGTSRNSISKQ